MPLYTVPQTSPNTNTPSPSLPRYSPAAPPQCLQLALVASLAPYCLRRLPHILKLVGDELGNLLEDDEGGAGAGAGAAIDADGDGDAGAGANHDDHDGGGGGWLDCTIAALTPPTFVRRAMDSAWGYAGVSISPSDRTRGALSILHTLHLCLFHRVDGGLGQRVTAWAGSGAVAAALGHALGGGRFFDVPYRLAGAELMATSPSGGNRNGTGTGTDTGTATGTAARLPDGPIAWLLAARLAIQVAAVGTHFIGSLDGEWRRSRREAAQAQVQARARAQALDGGSFSLSDTSTTRATRDVSTAPATATATATATPGTAATTSSSSSDAPKCALCLGPRVNPAVPRCGHVFCWDCIVQWAARRAADQPCHCPVCRALILPQQIRLLRGFR